MIKLIKKIPPKVVIAVSGGVDSMALLDFIRRRHEVTVAFFNHRTETSEIAQEFLKEFCSSHSIDLFIGKISSERPSSLSAEEHWRNERYKFLSEFSCVLTAHTLDDCVETWVWSSLNGTPKLIPVTRGNVIRPLLCTRKVELISWCKNHNVPWVEDKSNLDTKYMRNFIRHEMMPSVLRVNPGIYKMLEKKIRQKYEV